MDIYEAMQKRRDTRHFSPEPLPQATLLRALHAAIQAPSVGLSQPWRFIDISGEDRQALIEDFGQMRRQAEQGIVDPAILLRHQGLKLEALREAPTLLAVFCAYPDPLSYTIGIIGNIRALEWSCACAIQNLWLALTAEGYGAGWLSILNLKRLARHLKVADSWEPMGILCIGRPSTDYQERPMLEQQNWKKRDLDLSSFYGTPADFEL